MFFQTVNLCGFMETTMWSHRSSAEKRIVRLTFTRPAASYSTNGVKDEVVLTGRVEVVYNGEWD